MTKKLNGWYRLFIVFAGLWTVGSISILSVTLYHNLEEEKRIIKFVELKSSINEKQSNYKKHIHHLMVYQFGRPKTINN